MSTYASDLIDPAICSMVVYVNILYYIEDYYINSSLYILKYKYRMRLLKFKGLVTIGNMKFLFIFLLKVKSSIWSLVFIKKKCNVLFSMILVNKDLWKLAHQWLSECYMFLGSECYVDRVEFPSLFGCIFYYYWKC